MSESLKKSGTDRKIAQKAFCLNVKREIFFKKKKTFHFSWSKPVLSKLCVAKIFSKCNGFGHGLSSRCAVGQ